MRSLFCFCFFSSDRKKKKLFLHKEKDNSFLQDPFSRSLYVPAFPAILLPLNYMFKSWRNDKKAYSFLLFNVSLLCVSFPFGPPAAEVCGNNHPPTVCSLAASPVPCMGLFMFLSTNNNLKEHSGSSLGMQRCETACRSWMLTVLTDRTDCPGKPPLPCRQLMQNTQIHNKCGGSGTEQGLIITSVALFYLLSFQTAANMRYVCPSH